MRALGEARLALQRDKLWCCIQEVNAMYAANTHAPVPLERLSVWLSVYTQDAHDVPKQLYAAARRVNQLYAAALQS